MKSRKPFLFLTLLACLSLSSCYHEFPGGGGGGGGTGSANVSFVLVADTPPATLGLVSLKVVPTAITLTPATGTATTLPINSQNGYSFDLVRLQSDSAFLGTASQLATGTYSSITISFSSATIAFFNGTGTALTNPVCPANDICIATFAGPFTATITTTQAISANAGFGIDINLANAITVSGTTLSLNFGNTNAASVFTLPRANTNLQSGQLDLIEDFTGIASISGTAVTVTPAAAVNRAPLTASTASGTVYDTDPSGTLCVTQTTLSGCFTSTTGQAASMDAILNSDGTFTIQEIEPLLASPAVDTVEGTVVSINSQTQFALVVQDIIPAATNSLIGSLTAGAPLTVNLAVGPTFLVDSKGLPIANSFPSNYTTFTGGTNTTTLNLGQTVAVRVTAFTAATANIIASSTASTVTLRWSRFTAAVSAATTPQFSVTSLPGYFNFTQGSILGVQIFGGTQGLDGVTNLDGILNGNPPSTATTVGIRALYIENPGFTLTPPFFAAKVRQH
jgi:hypothetical protein